MVRSPEGAALTPHSSVPPHILGLTRALEVLGSAQRTLGARIGHELDLPRATIGVLLHLARNGATQVGCLAQHLKVDMSVASRHVTVLATAGLVERTVADDDRRGRSVALTEAGRTKVDQLFTRLTTDLTAVFADWAPEELDAAASAVTSLAGAINDMDASAASSPRSGADGAAGPRTTNEQKDRA